MLDQAGQNSSCIQLSVSIVTACSVDQRGQRNLLRFAVETKAFAGLRLTVATPSAEVLTVGSAFAQFYHGYLGTEQAESFV